MGLSDRPRSGVLVADQNRFFRAGVRALLMDTGSWQQYRVDEAESTEEAMAMLDSGGYPIVLMAYDLPGRGGIKATEMIHSRWPAVSVIAVTDSDDGEQAERILAAGAKGCILRNIGLDTLLAALRTVMGGRRYLSNEIAQQLLNGNAGLQRGLLERLTNREREVYMHILTGLRDAEIASKMGISKRTVDKHRQHIHYKLGTSTPVGLVQAGLKMGLVRVQE